MSDQLTADEWQSILFTLGVREKTAQANAPVFSDLIKASGFSKGWDEIDDFLAQLIHESGYLERLVENLNYRAPRLMEVWPTRFKTLEAAQPYAGNPQKLAERVYGGRMGNDQPGDGHRYRGRGYLMITGKDNYELLQTELGEPLVDKPELLETPRVALLAAIAWWERRVPDSAIGNVELVTRAVNGGAVGLRDRLKLARLADNLV